jgi:uncharacterized protein YeaO (DUF488 family)
MIKLKRVYDPAESDDGERILVERLWPRGIAKEKAHIDKWFKEVAPSTDLRKWFNHNVEKWPEFQQRYEEELQAPEKQSMIKEIVGLAETGSVTLIYAARDTTHNGALVLKLFLEKSSK